MKHYKKIIPAQKDKGDIKIVPLVSHKEIKANIGFLGMKGKMLKSLLDEKKIEKEY